MQNGHSIAEKYLFLLIITGTGFSWYLGSLLGFGQINWFNGRSL